jgi:hypothetical protein
MLSSWQLQEGTRSVSPSRVEALSIFGRTLVKGSYTNDVKREGTVSVVQRRSNIVEKPANSGTMFVVQESSFPDVFSGYTDLRSGWCNLKRLPESESTHISLTGVFSPWPTK